jgi:hypothetical protein
MSAVRSAPASSSDDPVIYFTLIDFLLQIIFCSLMLFMVFQHSSVAHARQQANAPAGPPDWVQDPLYLPLMRDMTPFITVKKDRELRELLQRLKDHDALKQFLNFLRSNPDSLRVLEQCRANPTACQRFGTLTVDEIGELAAPQPATTPAVETRHGAGKPPCLAGDPALLSVDAYDDRLVVTGISALGARSLKAHRLALRAGQIIRKSEVLATLAPLNRAECRYAIRYVKRGDSEDMRHLTEQAVHPSIVRGAAGAPR